MHVLLATRGIWHRATVERRAPFCARLGLAVQAVPAVHSLGHLQLNIVVGQRKVQKYFLPLSLSLSLFRFSLLLLVFMVCQLTRLLHLFNTNRVQLGKPKGKAGGGKGVGGYCRRCRRNV